MNLGRAIKSIRKKKNLNQEQFANAIGITQTSLSLLESGVKQPSKSTMEKISEIYKIPQPFIYFLALDESDIPEGKKDLYKILEPGLKTNIRALFDLNSDE